MSSAFVSYREQIISALDLTEDQKQVIADIPFPEKKVKVTKQKRESKFPRKKPSFLFFMTAYRNGLRDENGKISIGPKEVMVEGGARWQLLKKEEKDAWEEKAVEDFEKSKTAFMEANPGYVNNAGKKPKEPKEPKLKEPRASSAFVIFKKEFLETTESKGKEATELAKESWEGLCTEEREPYEEKALVSKEYALKWRAFAKDIVGEQLSDGVVDDKAALKEDALKRWELKQAEEAEEAEESEESEESEEAEESEESEESEDDEANE